MKKYKFSTKGKQLKVLAKKDMVIQIKEYLVLGKYTLLILILLFLANIILLQAIRVYIISQTCMTREQVAASNKCLYILGNKIFEKGTKNNPHKGHPCGIDVTAFIPGFHLADMAQYLDPSYTAEICSANPTPTPLPTLLATPLPTPVPTPNPSPSSNAQPSPNPSPSSNDQQTPNPSPSLYPTSTPASSPPIGGGGIASPNPTPTYIATPLPTNNGVPTPNSSTGGFDAFLPTEPQSQIALAQLPSPAPDASTSDSEPEDEIPFLQKFLTGFTTVLVGAGFLTVVMAVAISIIRRKRTQPKT